MKLEKRCTLVTVPLASVGGTAVLVDVSGDLSRNWPLRKRGEIRCSILNRKQGELGRDGYHGVPHSWADFSLLSSRP
jgi:hypothetical protein